MGAGPARDAHETRETIPCIRVSASALDKETPQSVLLCESKKKKQFGDYFNEL